VEEAGRQTQNGRDPVGVSAVSGGVSAGVVDSPSLSDDGDLDLARVLQALLDLLGDVSGEPGRRQVVDPVRRDEDANLAPAWIANDFSTPSNEFATPSSASRRLM
jgi:hypothetical protein